MDEWFLFFSWCANPLFTWTSRLLSSPFVPHSRSFHASFCVLVRCWLLVQCCCCSVGRSVGAWWMDWLLGCLLPGQHTHGNEGISDEQWHAGTWNSQVLAGRPPPTETISSLDGRNGSALTSTDRSATLSTAYSSTYTYTVVTNCLATHQTSTWSNGWMTCNSLFVTPWRSLMFGVSRDDGGDKRGCCVPVVVPV